MMHHDLIKTLRGIVDEIRVLKAAIVEEARGMRLGDATRPGNIVVSDFAEASRHLVLNRVATTVYRNNILSKVAAVPGFAAKHVEDKKSKVDDDSTKPVAVAHGGRHTCMPFAIEDGGRIGAHEQATFRMLAKYVLAKGRLPPGHCTQHPLYPILQSPCGSVGGNNASQPSCTSSYPAKSCGT